MEHSGDEGLFLMGTFGWWMLYDYRDVIAIKTLLAL